MQNCKHCRIRLAIGITGELLENGTSSPDIVCLNCGWVNPAAKATYEALGVEDTVCVMCGRDLPTIKRSDGRYYCSQCWIVWNS